MSKYAGIIKSNEGLRDALVQLYKIKNASLETHNFDIDNFEANCILEVAILLIQDAQTQIANKGVFYNCDLV